MDNLIKLAKEISITEYTTLNIRYRKKDSMWVVMIAWGRQVESVDLSEAVSIALNHLLDNRKIKSNQITYSLR